jgi:hypothetical protein
VEAEATVGRLGQLWDWRKSEKDQEKMEVKEPDPLVKLEDSRNTLEELDHYLLTKRGISGAPLAYLVRDNIVPDPATDQGYGLPSHTDELVTRARHDGPSYAGDNIFLWGVIYNMTKGGFAYAWVSSQRGAKDGRQAYFQLKEHYLGDSFKGKVKSDADKVLESTFYDGKSRNFTFEAYCIVRRPQGPCVHERDFSQLRFEGCHWTDYCI